MTAQQLDNLIYQTVRKRGFSDLLARLAVQQARHETANYTSRVFRDNNNLFGYKYVRGSKWQAGRGRMSPEGNNYALYKTYQDSVNELVDWLQRRDKQGTFKLANITDSSSYARALKAGNYYGDPVSVYERGLIAADDKIIIAAAGGLTGLLVIAGLLYMTSKKD